MCCHGPGNSGGCKMVDAVRRTWPLTTERHYYCSMQFHRLRVDRLVAVSATSLALRLPFILSILVCLQLTYSTIHILLAEGIGLPCASEESRTTKSMT